MTLTHVAVDVAANDQYMFILSRENESNVLLGWSFETMKPVYVSWFQETETAKMSLRGEIFAIGEESTIYTIVDRHLFTPYLNVS